LGCALTGSTPGIKSAASSTTRIAFLYLIAEQLPFRISQDNQLERLIKFFFSIDNHPREILLKP
jgi:hypothetical protein